MKAIKICRNCKKLNDSLALVCGGCGSNLDDCDIVGDGTDRLSTAREQWTKADLMEVANRQKSIMWMILISLVAAFIPFATIVTAIIQIFFIYKLATAVRSSAAWVYIILSFVPLIGLLALLHINGKAMTILRTNGVKVGLMGARMDDFNKI
jgi:hypothetical protein